MTKTFLSLLLLSATLFSADKGQWLLGLDIGSNGTNITQNDSSVSDDKRTTAYGAKIGFQEETARVFLGYNHVDEIKGSDFTLSSDNVYVQLDGFSSDFTIIGGIDARVFLGGHIGLFIPTLVNTAGTDVGKNSFMGGAQGGLIFLMPADMEFELAYRHMWTTQENDISINAGNAYAALNIKF